MPKASTHKSKTTSISAASPLLIFTYGNKRVLAKRQDCYESAVISCRRLFSIQLGHMISFHTKDLDVCDGELAEISAETWAEVIPQLNGVTVISENLHSSGPARTASGTHALTTVVNNVTPRPRRVKLNFRFSDNTTLAIEGRPDDKLERVLHRQFIDHKNLCLDSARLLSYDHERIILDENTSFGSLCQEYEIEDYEEIYVSREQRGGKPVVYLFSPTTIEASVKLSLVPEWRFSAIYPVVAIKAATAHTTEIVNWRVCVRQNGDLTELTTGLDVAYLFWEALTNPTAPDSPPASPRPEAERPGVAEAFVPNNARVDDTNSVLLPVEMITPYLDKTLMALGLHTEARTSFITYWLPSILKHKHVALRFLPQAAYEKAAPLEVSPVPDVVTRVFMLFRGIEHEEIEEWEGARRRASVDVAFWVETVGVNAACALDKKLFRVLEWGGMEIYGS